MGKKLAQKGPTSREGKPSPRSKAAGPGRQPGPRHVSPARETWPAPRDAVLLARVVELLPHLGSPRLALFLLAAVFLLQLLALVICFFREDLIVDVPNQEAGEFH